VGGMPEAPSGGIDADWPTLDVLESRYIDRVLARTHGNKTSAANILGIDRRTIQRLFARAEQGKS
jgi:Fis family transcriptional regulator, factor for inversion stimulation protein